MKGVASLTLALCLAPTPASRGQEAPLLAPRDATLLAAADAAALTTDLAARTRYLWTGNPATAKDLARLRLVLAGHCNQLSTSSDLTPPREVKGAGGRVLAVVLDDYGWKAATWDLFAESEPYFYATVVTTREVEGTEHWPGGDYEGRYYAAGDYKVTRQKEVKTRVLAPWLDAKAAAGLALATGAKAPIVHANVFLDFTGAAGDLRKPDYYDFLGVKTEKDFQKVGGIEVGKDVAFRTDLLAAVGVSGVTQEPRAIQNVRGRSSYWRSFDVKRGSARDDKNALRVLGGDGKGGLVLKHDASEQYLELANGLWSFGLFNAAGAAQASAPDDIAVDPAPLTRNNHRVTVCVSCVRCHAEGGLQGVDDWYRNFPPELDLLAGDLTGKKPVDYEDVKRLRAQYRRRLDPFIDQDRKRYAAALLEVTGMKPEEWARAFPETWQAAADPAVTLDYAARDLGVTPEQITKALDRQVRTRGSVDPVLAVFLLPAARQRPLLVTQWREAIPLLQQYLAEVPK